LIITAFKGISKVHQIEHTAEGMKSKILSDETQPWSKWRDTNPSDNSSYEPHFMLSAEPQGNQNSDNSSQIIINSIGTPQPLKPGTIDIKKLQIFKSILASQIIPEGHREYFEKVANGEIGIPAEYLNVALPPLHSHTNPTIITSPINTTSTTTTTTTEPTTTATKPSINKKRPGNAEVYCCVDRIKNRNSVGTADENYHWRFLWNEKSKYNYLFDDNKIIIDKEVDVNNPQMYTWENNEAICADEYLQHARYLWENDPTTARKRKK
jgi:hypothetical protein